MEQNANTAYLCEESKSNYGFVKMNPLKLLLQTFESGIRQQPSVAIPNVSFTIIGGPCLATERHAT